MTKVHARRIYLVDFAKPYHLFQRTDLRQFPHRFGVNHHLAIPVFIQEVTQDMQALFRQILINVYAGALSMAKDQTVKLLPHGQNDGTEAIVRTAMMTPGKPDIQMVYRLRNIKEKGWRVIDVNVEGVWLVSNYRNQFGSIAASEGIEGLIKKMQERVKATK